MPKFLLMAGECTLCNNSTKNYMKFAFQFGKNLKFYSYYHLIHVFALLYVLLPLCSNKIKKDDLLEVLGLNQIVKIFQRENESNTALH